MKRPFLPLFRSDKGSGKENETTDVLGDSSPTLTSLTFPQDDGGFVRGPREGRHFVSDSLNYPLSFFLLPL